MDDAHLFNIISENFLNINPFVALMVFILTSLMDGLHAIYTKAIADKRAAYAATSGAMIYLFAGVATIFFTDNSAYLLFVVLGSWFGTYLAIKSNLS